MNVDRVVIWLMANNANANTLCFDIKTAENPENSWKHGLYNEVGISILYVNALSDCMKSFTLRSRLCNYIQIHSRLQFKSYLNYFQFLLFKA